MTPKIRTTRKLARQSALILTSVLAGSLLLTGCVTEPTDDPIPSSSFSASPTPSPSPSASPSETTTSAPASSTEATAAAEAKLLEFVEAVNAILREQGASPERIDAVAVPPASTEVMQAAEAIAAEGRTITGGNTITVTAGTAGDLVQGETTVPFGAVTLTTCYDGSASESTLPNGDPAPKPPNPRTVSEATVVYLPSDEAWFVQNIVDTGETC